jgi:hypothetical protein
MPYDPKGIKGIDDDGTIDNEGKSVGPCLSKKQAQTIKLPTLVPIVIIRGI